MPLPFRLITLTKRFLNAASLARSLHDQHCTATLREALFVVDPASDLGGQYESSLQMYQHLAEDWPGKPTFAQGPAGPFNFSRSANWAIRHHVQEHHQDILLVNDDTVLLTPCGTALLHEISTYHGLQSTEPVALLVPAVNGLSSKRTLHRDDQDHWGQESYPFIWAYIPAKAWREIGPLDERFDGYGWEDEDWQRRAFAAGWITYKTSRVRVEHLPPDCSTYRSKANWLELEARGRARFEEKWSKGEGQG